MNRTWFPSSRENGSFLRYDAGPDNNFREPGSSPHGKTWPTVIECGLLGGIILTFVIKLLW